MCLAGRLLAVAEEMLAGEIAHRREKYDLAFTHLRAAIALEDASPYDEPWVWMHPSAMRPVRFSSSRGERQRPRLSIGRISASAARYRALRSIPTIYGRCAGY